MGEHLIKMKKKGKYTLITKAKVENCDFDLFQGTRFASCAYFPKFNEPRSMGCFFVSHNSRRARKTNRYNIVAVGVIPACRLPMDRSHEWIEFLEEIS